MMTDEERILRLTESEWKRFMVCVRSFEVCFWIPDWADLERAPPKNWKPACYDEMCGDCPSPECPYRKSEEKKE